jgi:TolB protein
MRLRALLLTLAAALLFSKNLPGNRLPPVPDNRIVGIVQRESITIESADPEIAALARKAFGLHGAYSLTTNSGTRLQLAKTGPTAVHLVFTSKSRGTQTLQDIGAATLADAVLAACDTALAKDGKRPFLAGKIAFVSDRSGRKEIYASDLLLQNVRQLTRYNSLTLAPRWTHTGDEVLHTTYANKNFTDIYAVNATNPAQRRPVVVGARGSTTGAVSNPRTGQLAFASSARGDMDIFTAPATGKPAKLFVETTKGNVETDPAWSADGTQLAFVSGAAGRPGIHVANAAGTTSRRIRTPGIGSATEPAWNPVFPTKIAFTFQEKGGYRLGVVDVATGLVTRLTTHPDDSYEHPAWCADGRHLVATRASGKTSHLVLIDTLIGVANADADANPAARKVSRLSGANMSNCGGADYRAPAR